MKRERLTLAILLSFTARVGDCLEWQKAKDKDGYGEILLNRKRTKAHRVSHLLSKGILTPGLQILHSCDNPACINPDHLREGTCKENMLDKAKKGRCPQQKVTHCPAGHLYVDRDVRTYLSGPNIGRTYRICHLCARRRSKIRSRTRPRTGRYKQAQFMKPEEMKAKRIAANMTRPELAAKMGLGEINASQRIYSMETGKRGITQATAKLLEMIFSNPNA